MLWWQGHYEMPFGGIYCSSCMSFKGIFRVYSHKCGKTQAKKFMNYSWILVLYFIEKKIINNNNSVLKPCIGFFTVFRRRLQIRPVARSPHGARVSGRPSRERRRLPLSTYFAAAIHGYFYPTDGLSVTRRAGFRRGPVWINNKWGSTLNCYFMSLLSQR